MKDCGIKHTQEEELKIMEYSAFMRDIIKRYFQHEGLACASCIDNVFKLRSIINGDE